MRATFETLPTELLNKIILDYGAHELVYVSCRCYNIAAHDIICSGVLHSPESRQAIEERGQDHRDVRDYLNFISNLNPGSLYTNSIEEYHLNLNHFHDDIRLDECVNLADFISYFPNLQKLVLTLKQLREPEQVYTSIGSSLSCVDLTINIEYIDDHSTNELASAVLQQYPNLKTLRLHRPSFVSSPGLDLDRQQRFIAAFNTHIKNNPEANLCRPTAILFKIYKESLFFSEFESYETVTNVNYIHIYKWNRKTGYTEPMKSKGRALLEYYPEAAGNPLGNPRKNRSTTDPLTRREFEMIDASIQRLAYRNSSVAAELRALITWREEENARYRDFSVETELNKLLSQLEKDTDYD